MDMKKELNEIVSENVCKLLELLGESSVSAGKKARMDQKTVWNMTRADSCNPNLRNLSKLANALGVTPSLLMIESAFDEGLPDSQTARLLQRVISLPPKARSQVSEFIEMWERPKDNE